MAGCSRFAPSTTGPAHPGTLLSALLVWLDARRRGDRVVLRLEDLDLGRSSPARRAAMVEQLAWFGLDWDRTDVQSDFGERHAAALDRLAAAGALYPCRCSRAARRGARLSPDGGHAYDNRCRDRALPAGGWRATDDALRARLPDRAIAPIDEGGLDLAQTPSEAFGDPVVRRKDGAIAYHLAVVVDDDAAGVTRVVRGRDLATSTATQVQLRELLGFPTPSYRHHLLFLEPGRSGKLAKLHGAVGVDALRERYAADALRGVIARAAGLAPTDAPVSPATLLAGFDWARVRTDDVVVAWDGAALAIG